MLVILEFYIKMSEQKSLLNPWKVYRILKCLQVSLKQLGDIYIYIYRERERDRERILKSSLTQDHNS